MLYGVNVDKEMQEIFNFKGLVLFKLTKNGYQPIKYTLVEIEPEFYATMALRPEDGWLPEDALTHVAVKIDNKLYTAPKPYRHHHIFNVLGNSSRDGIHGFARLNEHDEFVFYDREKGMNYALIIGQIARSKWFTTNHLHSEDLWETEPGINTVEKQISYPKGD